MSLRNFLLAALVCAMAASAQTPIAGDSPFQVKYAVNLTAGESYINIGNDGARGDPLYGPGYGGPSGNICVNVYVLDPGEELVSCCSCLVTPSALARLRVNADLTANAVGPIVLSAVMVKLVATLAGNGGTGTTCYQSAATASYGNLTSGMVAWGTTLQLNSGSPASYLTTEQPFKPSTLSPDELASLTGRCVFIIGDLGGYGICNSCRIGALGAPNQQM